MYITSDLFGAGSDHPRHAHCDSSTTLAPTWNTSADSHPAALGKRKRRMDTDPAEGLQSSSNHTSCQRLSPSGRAILKRQAFGHTIPTNTVRPALFTQGPTKYLNSETRPQKQPKHMSLKKCPVLIKSTSHLMDMEPDTVTTSDSYTSSAAVDLRPCHICHTAPKRRKDLENYQECIRCNEHTCFICVRQCADGCREKICRKCCVEVGEEGDTSCLSCYARTINSRNSSLDTGPYIDCVGSRRQSSFKVK